jgi:hypothetical protein
VTFELDDARSRLRAFLQRTRNADGGWPYLAGKQSRLEPTSWVMLATETPASSTPLQAWQRGDGLLVEPVTGVPNYAFNGLAIVALGSQPAPWAQSIVRALLVTRGVKLPAHPMVRQDGALQAWPWFQDTFSWVEPTAWCMLALKKVTGTPRPPEVASRVEEAERLLADRVCPGGGWNYGNGLVYGKDLPAHVPATAAAVLAMQDLKALAIVREAIAFLVAHSRSEGSSAAAALGWMALRVVGADDAALGETLETRATVAEDFGNVANAAMLLYALECRSAGLPPRALML